MRWFLIKEWHTDKHTVCLGCVCLYRNWKKQWPYRLKTRLSSVVNSEGSITGQCQSRKPRARASALYCYTQRGREREKEGRGCLRMVSGKLQRKPIGRKNGCSRVWRMQSRGECGRGIMLTSLKYTVEPFLDCCCALQFCTYRFLWKPQMWSKEAHLLSLTCLNMRWKRFMQCAVLSGIIPVVAAWTQDDPSPPRLPVTTSPSVAPRSGTDEISLLSNAKQETQLLC